MSLIKKVLRFIEGYTSSNRLNVFKTLYVNLLSFPIKQALSFPILVYGPMRIRQWGGEILCKSKCCRLIVGKDYTGYRTRGPVTMTLFPTSKLIIDGVVKIYQGASVLIGPKASLVLGDSTTVGDNAEIICKKEIRIGKHVDLTWDTQVTDFKSHPILNMATHKVSTLFSPVVIGDYCWIGNRTTIQPGTVLPDRTIVASNSLLNKNYIEMGVRPYSLLAGSPAKVRATDVARIYSNESLVYKLLAQTEADEIEFTEGVD